MKTFYVYILCNKRNGTIYTGVTSDLIKRIYEHKNSMTDGFTNKYDVHHLVWYENHKTAEEASAARVLRELVKNQRLR